MKGLGQVSQTRIQSPVSYDAHGKDLQNNTMQKLSETFLYIQ